MVIRRRSQRGRHQSSCSRQAFVSCIHHDGNMTPKFCPPPSKRDSQAAKRLLTSVIRRHGFVPKRIVTDKLRSYGAAKREVAAGLDHRAHKGLNVVSR